ncbi:MAG: phosphodiester glycosidase family protein [Pseudomonadota bacterium]
MITARRKVLLALMAFATTATVVARSGHAEPAEPPPHPPGHQLAPGARSIAVNAGGVAIFLIQFDLEEFRAEVVVGDGTPPSPSTASAWRQRSKAVAVVNGGFFDERIAPLGLRIAGGKTRVALRPRVDWGVLVVADKRARIVHSREFRPDPTVSAAIQVGPRLIVDGVPVRLKPQSARRTAVGLDREGRVLTLVLSDRPIQAAALASRLAELGIFSALMLDGGPSTQLSLDLGNAHIDFPGVYPVPDLLAIHMRHAR